MPEQMIGGVTSPESVQATVVNAPPGVLGNARRQRHFVKALILGPELEPAGVLREPERRDVIFQSESRADITDHRLQFTALVLSRGRPQLGGPHSDCMHIAAVLPGPARDRALITRRDVELQNLS